MTDKFSRRLMGRAVRDNLAIIAGFGTDHLDKLRAVLDEWLEDRHPSIARAGYTLHVIERSDKGSQLRVYERGSPVTPFSIERKVHSAFGVFGAFCDRELKFFDLGTGCAPILLGKDDEASTQEDAEQGVEMLPELVRADERAQYADLVTTSAERGKFQLIYARPLLGDLLTIARRGGTGLLEAYPTDADVRARVHKRNLAVVTTCTYAYELYLRSYISRVEAVDPDPKLATAAGLPHPELQVADPYWQPYWKQLAANGADLGTIIFSVQGADGAKKSGVEVKLLGDEAAPVRTRTSGEHGEAIFRDISTGKYQAVAGSDANSGSTSSRRVPVTVVRGVDSEALITLS